MDHSHIQADLKRRLRDAECQNEEMILKIQRTKKLIQRARLERTILLERLEQSTGVAADPATVESPPQSPIETIAPSGPGGDRRKEAPDRKRNQPRDPRLPKRAQNAYILFCEAEKENVKRRIEEDPNAEIQDITKAMAEAWKSLGQEGRKKYSDMYKEDRLRYLKEMSQVESAGLSATDQKEKQRAIKQLREVEQQDGDSNDEQTEDEKPKPGEPPSEAEPPSEIEPPSEAEPQVQEAQVQEAQVQERVQEPQAQEPQVQEQVQEPQAQEPQVQEPQVQEPQPESVPAESVPEPTEPTPTEPTPEN